MKLESFNCKRCEPKYNVWEKERPKSPSYLFFKKANKKHENAFDVFFLFGSFKTSFHPAATHGGHPKSGSQVEFLRSELLIGFLRGANPWENPTKKKTCDSLLDFGSTLFHQSWLFTNKYIIVCIYICDYFRFVPHGFLVRSWNMFCTDLVGYATMNWGCLFFSGFQAVKNSSHRSIASLTSDA